jgi:hypothetical protein
MFMLARRAASADITRPGMAVMAIEQRAPAHGVRPAPQAMCHDRCGDENNGGGGFKYAWWTTQELLIW